MKEYEVFDTYLQNSKKIREFCNDREKMMFEVLRMDLSEEGKIHWLESIGLEIIGVLELIGTVSNERKSHLKLRE